MALQKRNAWILSFVFFAVVMLFIFPLYFSKAQILGSSEVALEITPQFPQPYEQIEIRLVSVTVDLNRSNISWFINDSKQLAGIGEKKLSFTAGGAGTISQVDVVIRTATGGSITRSVAVRPASVDILWSAHAYTPPFYKGKALAPSRGFVTFTAMPQLVTRGGSVVRPEDVVYTWGQRGIVLGTTSGYGKRRLVLRAGPATYQPITVSVVATSFDNTVTAYKTIGVRTENQRVIFYEKHPLLGVRYENALGNSFALEQDEITLRAEPYFFSLDDVIDGLLLFSWRVNNKPTVSLDEKKNEITLRREEDKGGRVQIGLLVENNNLDKVLQETGGSFFITF